MAGTVPEEVTAGVQAPNGGDTISDVNEKECCKDNSEANQENEEEKPNVIVNNDAEILAEAEKLKTLGNESFAAKKHEEAIKYYSEAISKAGNLAPGTFFSNRAVCRAACSDWEGARNDAAEAISRPGGLTKKVLFQKVRAERKLGLMQDAEATLAMAEENGLRADVEKLLGAEGGQTAKPAATVPPSPVTAKPPAATAAAKTNGDSPDAAAAAKEQGNAKYKEGAYREALTHYQTALTLLSSDDQERRIAILGNVAAAQLMLRRVDDCIATCQEALGLNSENVKLRQRLSSALLAKGDFAAARTALDEAKSEDPAIVSAKEKISEAESQLAAGEAALVKDKAPGKALQIFADLEQKTLFCYPAMALKMGRCYLELKNYPRVLGATQQVLRENPRSIEALLLRAEALYRNNDSGVDSAQWSEPLEQGQKLLREALTFDPDHQGAQQLRKRLKLLVTKQKELKAAFDSREFETSKEIIDTMLEQGHDNPMLLASLYCERARCGVRLKDWTSVLRDVGQATYRNHSMVQPYMLRAQALQALERHEDAVKELESLFSWHREQAVFDKLNDAKFLLRKAKRANYYELLGVPTIASQPEIKKAYKEKASEWHPDKKGHLGEEARKNAEEMFKRIVEAYEVLTDPVKKELYDKGHDLEGIEEQIQKRKQQAQGHRCGGGGCGHC